MNKSWVLHYKNKYPGGRVQASDSALDVYSASGEHVVSMTKNGAGQWQDNSEEMGLRDRHCLAPIPKEARVHKMRDGKIGLSEESEARKQSHKDYLCPKSSDKVLSCEDLKEHGFSFDASQIEKSRPQKRAAKQLESQEQGE